MDNNAIIQAEANNIVQTYIRPKPVFTHGKGVYLYDSDGNEYLDFVAGIAVMALGHSDPEWIAAVNAQAGQLTHVSNLYYTAPQVELAQKLVATSFADKVYFCNSGAEANESAIKFARKYARVVHGRDDKTNIVAFSGSFHGRTMGALAVTLRDKYQKAFEPLMPGVVRAEYNDLASAENAIDDQTCAVIVEPIQGEGGVRPASAEFLHHLRQLCDQHGALLIFDEVQCGLGRTGTLWAYEQYNILPDMLTAAKPLAGGLPIGATLATDAVADVMQPGDHASTFAGGPLVCSAAQIVLNRVAKPAFLAQVRDNSAYMMAQLRQRLTGDDVVEIRGCGFLIGVEFAHPVNDLITAALAHGLIVVNAGPNVLRLVPPLIVSREQIDTAIGILVSCHTTDT
ncbi:MAG: aspartate aminotransferase family protein [Anaerolineae bacterium]|nr:aspartate aminotransferase family protein [Anaerolineae bacterium]MCO5193457.1 aspartate aminotransferase family protein [Anaerolineae bacterium]